MRKYLIISFAVCLSLALISWGVVGHRTVAKIAEKHLSDKAKKGIHELIGDTSLADVSTYADQIRSHQEYKYTSPWHYINLPTGLSEAEFTNAVLTQNKDNVFNALIKCENDLIDPNKSKAEKVFALKLIVHFIGDLHQPMHVSRAEDQGGNTIMINFDGKQGNLHGLWDSGFIEHLGLSYEQLAEKYDHATAAQIDAWQHDGLIKWMYESYEVSSQLYKDAAANPNFDEAYYQAHLPIIADRIEKAGIRLAGVLNEAFSGGPYRMIPPVVARPMAAQVSASVSTTIDTVDPKDVKNYINKTVVTTGTISGTRLISSNNMTLLNVGAAFPDQDFTIMIRSENRDKFGQPDVDLKGKTVKVTGLVIDYRGKPEIEITDPKQLVVK